ncbi:hypothetical protein SAMN04489716_4970 [Actinoplanes derwentensis]|uniref:Uncharacterized protein n=1 Tax=Actinoplanes derwentensis TaxID=113562 RepID=A0A1H2BXG7_9ACTN|nr:hypothetical protein SAMN04489716_4970 [Actinoplanes derwentensis]
MEFADEFHHARALLNRGAGTGVTFHRAGPVFR